MKTSARGIPNVLTFISCGWAPQTTLANTNGVNQQKVFRRKLSRFWNPLGDFLSAKAILGSYFVALQWICVISLGSLHISYFPFFLNNKLKTSWRSKIVFFTILCSIILPPSHHLSVGVLIDVFLHSTATAVYKRQQQVSRFTYSFLFRQKYEKKFC